MTSPLLSGFGDNITKTVNKDMNFLKRLFNSNRANKEKPGKALFRGLVGAMPTRLTNWITATTSRINCEFPSSLATVVPRCRDVAKNNPVIRSYLSMCQKNVIGKGGFSLKSQLRKSDGSLDQRLNDEIEWKWYEFGKSSNGRLTVDGGLGHNDLDALILRTLLIDGECFIRIHRKPLSFEVIDSLSIDYSRNSEFSLGRATICRNRGE